MCRKILCSCCGCCCVKQEESKPVDEPTATNLEISKSDIKNRPEIELNSHEDDDSNVEAAESAEVESLKEPDANTEYILSKFADEIKNSLKALKPEDEQLTDLVLVGYNSQFIAGTDYFLKIFEPCSENYFHLRIYESLQGDLVLQRMSGPKKSTDTIEYF